MPEGLREQGILGPLIVWRPAQRCSDDLIIIIIIITIIIIIIIISIIIILIIINCDDLISEGFRVHKVFYFPSLQGVEARDASVVNPIVNRVSVINREVLDEPRHVLL